MKTAPRAYLSAAGILAAALVLTPACSTKVRLAAFKVPEIQFPPEFSAGAAKMEITPPPGFPFGGHGPAGNVAIGYWTRLYARAFYFKPRESHPFTMVSLDLWAVPEGLTQKVLELVNKEGVPLPPDRFVLAATHTHHSPGNFMTSRIHSELASFKAGFDPDLFKWLAKRIAKAVVKAAQGSEAARLTLFEGVSCNFQVNRSLLPFAENPEATDIINARNHACKATGSPPPARMSAVNPTLRVLRIDHAGGLAGLLVFHAVHPTALRARVPLYSGDFVNAAMTYLEKTYQDQDTTVVAGFFNGAEGDIIPPKVNRDLDEVAELGRKFGKEILDLMGRARSKMLPDPNIHSSRSLLPRTLSGFAKKPMGGVAALGGGELDRSQYSPEGWWDGVVSDKQVMPGHGNKFPAFDKRVPIPLVGDWAPVKWLVKWCILPPSHFPDHLPIALHVIPGLISFAVIPVEMTTAMGLRIVESIRRMEAPDTATATALQHVQIIGLANEYYSYTTTREEYPLQHYEGASTLLGENQGNILREQLLSLKPMRFSTEMEQPEAKFIAGGTKRFGPAFFIKLRSGPVQTGMLPDFELDEVIPKRLHFQEVKIPRFEWTEECKEAKCASDWAAERRSVQIIPADNAGHVVESESDLRLVSILRRSSIPKSRDKYVTRKWVAFWIPAKSSHVDYPYRFKVKPADTGKEICSERFTLGNLPTIRGILPRSLWKDDCPAGQ